MPRNGSNVYSKPAGTTAISGTTIESAKYNTTIDDLVNDANLARPVVAGGTGAATAAGARTNLEVPGLNTANTFTAPQTIEDEGEGGQVTLKEKTSGKVGHLDMLAASDLVRILNNMDGAGVSAYEFPPNAATKGANSVMRKSDVDAISPLDEDDFASDSDTRPPTQQSAKAYVDRLFDTVTNVTGSRSASTVYTNNTGGPMFVSIEFLAVNGGLGAISVDGSTVSASSVGSSSTSRVPVYTMVPDGSIYEATTTGNCSIDRWTEAT